MKKFLILLPFLLSGCVAVQTHHAKLWLLCYHDDTILPNGMYQNSELQLKCNKRSQVQFQYKFGETSNSSKWNDGLQKYIQEHK